MEGLIKGLIDVALGAGPDDRHRRDRPADDQGQQPDQRSRSTWAEVVSGDQEDGDRDDLRRQGHLQNAWKPEDSEQSETRRHDEEWEVAGSRPPRRSQQVADQQYQYGDYGEGGRQDHGRTEWGREESKEDNEGGWETVGSKPQRKHHKIQKDNWNGYKRPASEQEYSNDVEIGVSIDPTDEELSNLSAACNKLWELDVNRLVPGKDYEIDCAEGKKVYQKDDMAQDSLFSWLGEDVLRRPTFARFCSLLDNYNPHQGCREDVTPEEKQEQTAFIEEISRTAPIKYLHRYLLAKGIVSGDYQEFKRMLNALWFNLYGRGGTSGCSSAFEHVFVGEIKQNGEAEVSGFHNWLQFYLEEAKGRVDYQGYIYPRRRGQTPDSETQVLTIQFEWNGVLKSVSSTLVGVSPEFEVALYTLCFYVGQEDNHVELGPYPVNIKCYRLGERIGSAFPISDC